MSVRAFCLAGAVLVFGLGVGSASAAPIPFFYLVPTGPATVPTVVPTTSGATYQFWVDPSGINAPDCSIPINGACFGFYANLADISAAGSLTMTAFKQILLPGDSFHLVSPTQLVIITGDEINGNATPFEAGTLTIANSGSGPGDVTVLSSDSANADFQDVFNTVPQVLAVAAPEPGTLLLLGSGMGALAVLMRRSRG